VNLDALEEAINRRTEIIMAKIISTKEQNNGLQNIAQKTKDQATRTPLKTGDELRCSKFETVIKCR
jgi:hypothetical protein